MLKFYESFGGYSEISKPVKGCWVNVLQPTDQEIERLLSEFQVPQDVIRDIIDVDERPRAEFDDEYSLVIMRIPVESSSNGVPFYTVPLGIYETSEVTITLCSVINEVLPLEQPELVRRQRPKVSDSMNFILSLFLLSGSTYLKYLKQINQQTALIEQDLERSIRNKELNKLLKMEKCLVYFITSLKANESVLARLRNYKKNTLSEPNEDLLEDAIIENKQALDMAKIYSDIQSGMMDAFASVISNNLNVVMKQLTVISIFLMIPTLIASLFGMNIPNFMEDSKWGLFAVVGFSGLLSGAGVVLFRKKNWF
jgi:magnesium transporter